MKATQGSWKYREEFDPPTYTTRVPFVPKWVVDIYNSTPLMSALLRLQYTYRIKKPRIKFVMPKRKRR